MEKEVPKKEENEKDKRKNSMTAEELRLKEEATIGGFTFDSVDSKKSYDDCYN